MPFTFDVLPGRVVFGAGSLQGIEAELGRIGVKRAVVFSVPEAAGLATEVARHMGTAAALLYPGAAPKTLAEVTHSALLAVQSVQADGVVCIGDKVAFDLGKAITLRTGLPQLAVPTGLSGAEVTPFLDEGQAPRRAFHSDPKLLPRTVLYDPDLLARSGGMAVTPSIFVAMANALAGLSARPENPFVGMLAKEALRISASLVSSPESGAGEAWNGPDALYAGLLGGYCLAAAGPGFHHILCDVIWRRFDLAESLVHAALLPHTATAMAAGDAGALADAERALGSANLTETLVGLQRSSGGRGLAALGVREGELDDIVREAAEALRRTSEAVDPAMIGAVLRAAFHGEAFLGGGRQ